MLGLMKNYCSVLVAYLIKSKINLQNMNYDYFSFTLATSDTFPPEADNTLFVPQVQISGGSTPSQALVSLGHTCVIYSTPENNSS